MWHLVPVSTVVSCWVSGLEKLIGLQIDTLSYHLFFEDQALE